MKKVKTVNVKSKNLSPKYKFVHKGDDFTTNSVCQLVENTQDGTGWFIGLRKGTKNKIKCDFKKFDIYNADGDKVEIENDF